MWRGYCKGTIAVLGPQGKLKREIQLSAREPTNLAFGGKDGKTVFVSQRQGGFVESFRTDTSGPRGLFAGVPGAEVTRAWLPAVYGSPAPQYAEVHTLLGSKPLSREVHNLKFISFKLLAFPARMFRRQSRDETILLRMKPFSPWRADVPKRWLTINLPNEGRQAATGESCHAKRDCHQ